MAYHSETQAADASTSLPTRGRVRFSWQDVEDRLVEATENWRRSPDADARFSLGGRISSIWRQAWTDRIGMALIEQLDLPAPDEPKPLPLSRSDVARMTEASEWMRFVPEADRRLVIMALSYLARGRSVVPWLVIWKKLGRGKPGPDGLRMRYSRALTAVCKALNSGGTAEKSEGSVSSPQTYPPSK
jgi:hypothetical protein